MKFISKNIKVTKPEIYNYLLFLNHGKIRFTYSLAYVYDFCKVCIEVTFI